MKRARRRIERNSRVPQTHDCALHLHAGNAQGCAVMGHANGGLGTSGPASTSLVRSATHQILVLLKNKNNREDRRQPIGREAEDWPTRQERESLQFPQRGEGIRRRGPRHGLPERSHIPREDSWAVHDAEDEHDHHKGGQSHVPVVGRDANKHKRRHRNRHATSTSVTSRAAIHNHDMGPRRPSVSIHSRASEEVACPNHTARHYG